VRLSRKIIETEAMSEFMGEELSPGLKVQTDEEILDFIAKEGESAYHPSSTCKMGLDPQSVTDAALRVHGVKNLRVVDASVFPYVTNGNIYSPVMMVAEKAADIILGNSPLNAEHLPYYKKEMKP
jgi:choline dehydrogenase